MSQIEVKKIIKALNASDGAGVKLKKKYRTSEADYIDPFLMLDEFDQKIKMITWLDFLHILTEE